MLTFFTGHFHFLMLRLSLRKILSDSFSDILRLVEKIGSLAVFPVHRLIHRHSKISTRPLRHRYRESKLRILLNFFA